MHFFAPFWHQWGTILGPVASFGARSLNFLHGWCRSFKEQAQNGCQSATHGPQMVLCPPPRMANWDTLGAFGLLVAAYGPMSPLLFCKWGAKRGPKVCPKTPFWAFWGCPWHSGRLWTYESTIGRYPLWCSCVASCSACALSVQVLGWV